MAIISKGDAGDVPQFAGPGYVDTQIREAIRFCWLMLPRERRTVRDLKEEVRRLVERALEDIEEDAAVFGLTDARNSGEAEDNSP